MLTFIHDVNRCIFCKLLEVDFRCNMGYPLDRLKNVSHIKELSKLLL